VPFLLALAFAIAALGLFDDIFEGRTLIKFALIIGIGALAVRVMGPPAALPMGAYEIVLPYWVGLTGAVLWIFVCVNGINFMDGANGFMGSFMLIASFTLTTDYRLLYVGPILLLPFLADILTTMVSRLKRKENLFAAHSSHLYQKLIRAGWGHTKVTLTYLVAGVICANIAVFAVFSGMISSFLQ